MLALVLAIALAQTTQPVKVVDPATGLPVGVSTVSGAKALKVDVVPAANGLAANDGACVSVSTTTAILASNASRRGASLCARITNTDAVFVKLGTTATTADFPLEPGQCLNLGFPGTTYTGAVDGIANSGTQIVCAVELN